MGANANAINEISIHFIFAKLILYFALEYYRNSFFGCWNIWPRLCENSISIQYEIPSGRIYCCCNFQFEQRAKRTRWKKKKNNTAQIAKSSPSMRITKVLNKNENGWYYWSVDSKYLRLQLFFSTFFPLCLYEYVVWCMHG